MSDTEHFALRQTFYQAWSAYHEASAAYWRAIWTDQATADTGRLETVRATAVALDTAISALLAYFGQQAPFERDDEERAHVAKVQKLLQLELALLPTEE